MAKKEVSKWLKVVTWVFVILIVFLNVIGDAPTIGVAGALGAHTWTLIGGLIAIACGNKCSKWARKIKKSMNWAYVIGFFFSLLGLLGYWIYYNSKK